MKTSPILAVIIGFGVIGIIILGVIGIMGWTVLSNSPMQRDDLTCGGASGLTCPDGYTCFYSDEEGIIDPTGVCVVE
ncbi:MAG TPA: hypothetical protein DEG44_04980 [Candidatus Kerfeldbacteria bacterium]|nr:hypothetical protein [Candidatus Kerfeldbacteria bacterium]